MKPPERNVRHFTGPIEVDVLRDTQAEYNHLLLARQGMQKRAIATIHPRPEWENYCGEATAKIFANAHNMFDLLVRFERMTKTDGPTDLRALQRFAVDLNELLDEIAPKIEEPRGEEPRAEEETLSDGQ